jgi:hypothetical protein
MYFILLELININIGKIKYSCVQTKLLILLFRQLSMIANAVIIKSMLRFMERINGMRLKWRFMSNEAHANYLRNYFSDNQVRCPEYSWGAMECNDVCSSDISFTKRFAFPSGTYKTGNGISNIQNSNNIKYLELRYPITWARIIKIIRI